MTNKTTQRFLDGTGEKYLKDGRVRCQAISNSQVLKWREESDDYDMPTEYLWPECQCTKAAIEPLYVCIFHGGRSHINKLAPRKITDVMPINLREKLKVILDDPSYISRHQDIALVQARIWDLMEQLQTTDGGAEAWGKVANAITELNRGNDPQAHALLIDALNHHKDEKHIWQEFYKAELVLKDLTRTQVSTMKDLQAMATVEQVSSLVQGVLNVIIEGANKYIEDKHKRAAFTSFVSHNVAKLTNTSPGTVVAGISDSSRETDGNPLIVDQ